MKRSLKRKTSLGAAMAEGGVVLPVLAVFFGMIMYVHNSYQKKIDVQAESRFAAFSSAAHACSESAAGGEQRGVDVTVPAEGNAPDAEKDVAVDANWLETTANKTGTAVALKRTREVKGFSTVYCNPDGLGLGAVADGLAKLFAFAQYAFGFVSKWAAGLI